MLSKLISRVKEEKKQGIQKDDVKGKENSGVGNNLNELEKSYLNSRDFRINDDLSRFKVSDIDTVYYIPNYITAQDEEYLLGQIYSQPKERWSQLQYSNRRLQKWGGEVTKNGLENVEVLPPWLEKISEMLSKEKITSKKTNHVLLNEYQPGVGIMPHTDGPLYHPYVVILSLGSQTVFEFFKDYAAYKEENTLAKLLVEPRSLLIFSDDAYSKYMHAILEKEKDFVEMSYCVDKASEDIKIQSSNIDNLHLTSVFEGFKKQIFQNNDDGGHKREGESEIESQMWQIKREKRVSLTIRYVPCNL